MRFSWRMVGRTTHRRGMLLRLRLMRRPLERSLRCTGDSAGHGFEQHLAEKLACARRADLVGISAGHLFRSLKVSVGVTPFQYVAARRIELACNLIKSTTQTLSQIALAAGLCDQSQFCRVFRRRVGMTPSAWRRNYGRGAIAVQRPPSGNARGRSLPANAVIVATADIRLTAAPSNRVQQSYVRARQGIQYSVAAIPG
jgi:AraC-like DNA-binding protein